MTKGFSLIEVLIVVALVVLVAALAIPRFGNARPVEEQGFLQNVREFATLALTEAKERSTDVTLAQLPAGVVLSVGGNAVSDKTLTVPSGVTFSSTLTAHPDGSSDGSVRVVTHDGCTSLILSRYGDLQETPC